MKISFLVPDIFNPVLGPVTVLAGHLSPHFEVQIVGPDFGHGVCPMYRGAFDYTIVPAGRLYRFPNYFADARRLAAAVTGDIVIAVKAFGATVPVAWWLRRKRGARMVVYLDEWDGALMAQRSAGERFRRWLSNWHHPLDDVYCPWVEKLIPGADLVLSTNSALQKKFGGEILHMGVDTDFFKPQPAEQTAALKKELGLAGCRVIAFGGVVRPHKGIEVILDALVQLADPKLRLLIVGPDNEHVKALKANAAYQPYLSCTGSRPKSEMPTYLDVGDLIVLPLEDTPLAQTQTPCKIFEAMAMAKPIIGTRVSDLSRILEGCGETVPPGDVGALASAIRRVLDGDATEPGRRAREKCLVEYGHHVVAAKLVSLMEGLAPASVKR